MILNELELAVAGWLVPSLCAVIAVFLYRILGQFDMLNKTVVQLNSTMVKIDKDLSTKIVILESNQTQHAAELRGLTEVYNRVRLAENDIAIINAAGCKAKGEHCP